MKQNLLSALRLFPIFGLLTIGGWIVSSCSVSSESPLARNHKPTIDSITISVPNVPADTFRHDTMATGGTVQLKVWTTDVDGDSLSILWSTENGGFVKKRPIPKPDTLVLNETTPKVVWKAPTEEGTYGVGCKVDDYYTSVEQWVDLTVIAPADANHPPFVGGMITDYDTVQIGTTIHVVASAGDPDHNTLTYTWSADAGVFSPPDMLDTRWRAPTLIGNYYLRLNVWDGFVSVMDSMMVTVARIDTLYAATFDQDSVTGVWRYEGLLSGLGSREGTAAIAWDRNNRAMAVTAHSDYGVYGFKCRGKSFDDGIFKFTVKLPDDQFPQIAFLPKIVDANTYLLVGTNLIGGGWQVLAQYDDTLRYLGQVWEDPLPVSSPIRFKYIQRSYDDSLWFYLNDSLRWMGKLPEVFQGQKQIGIGVCGGLQSGAALFDNFLVTQEVLP